MDSNEVASKARSRLATPELSKWIEKIKIYMLDNPGFEPEATLHLRLTGAEREMLRAAAADGDGHSPPLDTGWPKDEIREVGILLFFRWSFVQHALREILYQLGEFDPGDIHEIPDSFFLNRGNTYGRFNQVREVAWEHIMAQSTKLFSSITTSLETRHDHILTWDRRHERVADMLADKHNKAFWENIKSRCENLADSLDDGQPEVIAVAPHPADYDIWWHLASQVIKKCQTMRHWPGVNEAAVRATAITCGQRYKTWFPHSDNTTWYGKFLTASADKTVHKGRPNFYTQLRRGLPVPPVTTAGGPGAKNKFQVSARYPQYEEEWVENMNAVADAANIWDVWTLLRMIKCEAASQKLEETMGPGGHGLLRKALMEGPRDMTNPCPLWTQCFRDFTELACYRSPMYQFHDVTDKVIVAELLKSVGLDSTGNWDLVSLDGTQRVWAFPDYFGNLDHYRHVLYLSEGVNKRYFEASCGFPGQTIPCRCKEQPRGEDIFDQGGFEVQGRMGSFSHNKYCQAIHGGEVVFARRKLKDSELVQNLDRFWVDWNDCMFIEGRGLDAHGYVIDRDTMYILETLPGIKARELKSKGLDEPRGLASACLFFNLKLENRESGATGRRVLQEIMGPEYHPRYSDFTHLINHNELDFSAQQNPRWPQPGFMTAQVPWKKATRYNQHGSVTCVEDLVSLRIMAESEKEPSSERLETFRRHFTACYDLVAGNRFKNMVHFYGFTKAPIWFGHGNPNCPDKPSLKRHHYTKNGLVSQMAWALVFEAPAYNSLMMTMANLSLGMAERETWLTILTFLYEIGTAVREIHEVLGRPYGLIDMANIHLRARSTPPLCALAANTPAAEYEPFLSAPSPAPPPADPHHHHDMTALSLARQRLSQPTESRDAYALGEYAAELIAAAAPGLSRRRPALEGQDGEPLLVFYVEVLAALEAVLRGDLEADLEAGVDGGVDGGVGSAGARPGGGRVKEMGEFLTLIGKVAEGRVVLDGVYPVPEASGWYELELVFPRVWSLLNKSVNPSRGGVRQNWFNRESVLLYWMARPAGWTWDEDPGSSGSEWDGLPDGGESVWNGSNRGGAKSDTTVVDW